MGNESDSAKFEFICIGLPQWIGIRHEDEFGQYFFVLSQKNGHYGSVFKSHSWVPMAAMNWGGAILRYIFNR